MAVTAADEARVAKRVHIAEMQAGLLPRGHGGVLEPLRRAPVRLLSDALRLFRRLVHPRRELKGLRVPVVMRSHANFPLAVPPVIFLEHSDALTAMVARPPIRLACLAAADPQRLRDPDTLWASRTPLPLRFLCECADKLVDAAVLLETLRVRMAKPDGKLREVRDQLHLGNQSLVQLNIARADNLHALCLAIKPPPNEGRTYLFGGCQTALSFVSFCVGSVHVRRQYAFGTQALGPPTNCCEGEVPLVTLC
mmetsp:Transcript_330/g.1090  ORF Transcript_330/g.1090 Transcript_330/m.1090 type:complete len:252 (-) Transcript_330:446-1201(-)